MIVSKIKLNFKNFVKAFFLCYQIRSSYIYVYVYIYIYMYICIYIYVSISDYVSCHVRNFVAKE